jgi:copper chaperone CopZ
VFTRGFRAQAHLEGPTMPTRQLRARDLAAAALAIAAVLPGCASTPTSPSDRNLGLAAIGDGTLAPGRYDLVVHGMSCPKCISNVDLQLKRIDGVADPKVDMKNGVVAIVVRHGAAPSRAGVAAAITDAGFTLAEIREVPR